MLEKSVNSNEAHGLETFFDHEVFRKSYQEVKKYCLGNEGIFTGKNFFDV